MRAARIVPWIAVVATAAILACAVALEALSGQGTPAWVIAASVVATVGARRRRVVRRADRSVAAGGGALQRPGRARLQPAAGAAGVGGRRPAGDQRAGRPRWAGRRRGRRDGQAEALRGHRAPAAEVARLRGGADPGRGGRLPARERDRR